MPDPHRPLAISQTGHPLVALSGNGSSGRPWRGDYTPPVAPVDPPNIVRVVLPDIQDVVALLPRDLADDENELLARSRLAFLNTQVTADIDDLDAAIDVLRARAAGTAAADPFGPRIRASSYEGLADAGDRAAEAGRLDLATVLALQYESGSIAADTGAAADPVPRAERRDPSGDLGARHGGDPATGPRSRGLRRARPVARGDDRDVVAGGR